MKRVVFSAVWAVACIQGLALLSGCGGGGASAGGGGGTQQQQPYITSFTSGTTTIEATAGTTLTAVFGNGSGVITPGNISVNSGTAVTVTPSSTTTYTLTVTGSSGTTPATQTAPVTVDPVPTISSFTAGATTIEAGASTTLTATFAGGTGAITPGNITVTSGTPVTVNPTVTTTYTLNVTPPVGTITAAPQTAQVAVDPVPTISSFTAGATTIEAGTSTTLNATFAGGAGVITPGNIAVTSGGPLTVNPTATTSYTLNVAPPVGTVDATPQTVIVTVDPAPTITSFTAAANPLVAGNSTGLTATFSGGTGVITPGSSGGTTGSITVTSGTAATVNPTQTTTYTLTVTPLIGNAITQTLSLMVNPSVSVCMSVSCSGPAISNLLMGMNLAVWYDDVANASSIMPAFENAGIAALRWPGGSTSDDYHWNGNNTNPANGVAPTPSTCGGAYQNPDTNYLSLIQDFEYEDPELSNGFDVALTADYGTNPTCTGGGDPSEAANWIQYAEANGGTVSYLTVGNEEYGNWEEDMHASPHNPTTYASAVIGPSGYYQLIKAQSATTKVGVVVDANCTTANGCTDGWDSTVLSGAKGSYDFAEYHYYPQNPGSESDTFLVQQAAQEFTTNINTVKTELQTAGEPNTPIYVGEIGSVSSNPGKQTWSITQGLYAGQILGEAMNDGIARLTWWIGFGNCNGNNGNMSSSLYGWQGFGAYNIFADGPGDTGGTNNSACSYGGAIGAMSPTAEAFNLAQNVLVAGQYPQHTAVVDPTGYTRAYAATTASGGSALMLFNLNETTAETVSVSLTGTSQTSSSGVTVMTYDKEIYDYTNTNCQADQPTCTYDSTHDYGTAQWAPPATTNIAGPVSLPLTLTLQPWSMNVVIMQP